MQQSQARGRWLTGVAADKQADLIPAGWFEAWADATWKTDPKGAAQNPPVLRAPNGVVFDGHASGARGGQAKMPYSATDIRVPTLLIKAEWDADTPTYMAAALFPRLRQRALQALRRDRRGHAHGDHGEEPHEPVPRGAAVPRRQPTVATVVDL